jgi:hypothetical protein
VADQVSASLSAQIDEIFTEESLDVADGDSSV